MAKKPTSKPSDNPLTSNSRGMGYICEIILPEALKLQIIKGGCADQKRVSKNLAAYECCKKLWEDGYMRDDLKASEKILVNIDRFSLEKEVQHDYPEDPQFEERFRRIIAYRIEGSRQVKYFYPITDFDPFIGNYAIDPVDTDSYIGHLFTMDYSKGFDFADINLRNADTKLGFVHFSTKLK